MVLKCRNGPNSMFSKTQNKQNLLYKPIHHFFLRVFGRNVFDYNLLWLTSIKARLIWASSWDFGTYHIGDHWRLRRACTSAQSRQSLSCSHTYSIEVDEVSDQNQTSTFAHRYSKVKHQISRNTEVGDANRCHKLVRVWFVPLYGWKSTRWCSWIIFPYRPTNHTLTIPSSTNGSWGPVT